MGLMGPKFNVGRFEKPLTKEEIEAAKIAAEKVFEKKRKKEEAERPQREREEQAKIRLGERLAEESPHVITEKAAREAEELTKELEKKEKSH